MAKRKESEGFRVFKPTYRDRSGEQCTAAKHHIQWTDHRKARRRLTAYADYSASTSFARKLRALTDLRAAGERPDADLARWIETLDDQTIGKLCEWDILPRRVASSSMSLDEHLDAFADATIARGRTLKYVNTVTQHVRKIAKGCGFERFNDLDAETVEAWLHEQVQIKKMKETTRNQYRASLVVFANWMKRSKRVGMNPVEGIEKLNAERERRRRALTVDELTRLLTATQTAPDIYRVSGADRVLLYWTAAETGLRANELRNLTRQSFDLDGPRATVTAEWRTTKNRKRATLPIRSAELVRRLRERFAMMLPDAPVFTVPQRTAEMIRNDLERAGINPVDAQGRVVDFHALRNTCATNLARGGATPAEAQAHLRHADPTLTMNIYTQLEDEEKAAAVDHLPDLHIRSA